MTHIVLEAIFMINHSKKANKICIKKIWQIYMPHQKLLIIALKYKQNAFRLTEINEEINSVL